MDPRRPAIPIESEEDPEFTIVMADGTTRKHYNLIYTEEDAERIRLGYCCIQCGESQVGHGGEPFPEHCALCRFPMRDRQLARYAQEWQGHIRIGPSTTLEEEIAIAEEIVAREEHGKVVSKPNIFVPSIWH